MIQINFNEVPERHFRLILFVLNSATTGFLHRTFSEEYHSNFYIQLFDGAGQELALRNIFETLKGLCNITIYSIELSYEDDEVLYSNEED